MNMISESLLNLAVELEKSRSQIMVSGDAEKLAGLFSDDLYYGHSGGYWDDKESFVQKFSDGLYNYHRVEIQVESATLAGNSSLVVHGKVTLQVTLHGTKKTMTSIYLAVWRKEVDVWRFLAHQTAMVQG
ncbi:nuclear transport factor 2 family protein [Mucilaginibacter robiniae]|uniref:Nuclear transport factor 2 family protein n=1 Tax=Mucilaginibacter robiniae TaxID=2728022 RepID=A0A7L5EB77_9SPHI|nr:nuclear transport factor 2 family protein [Mucilaginibacter robiniae]QJD98203.1 nuclear transport factor 2 family protein [Mucilaginibacter robiniae]